MSAKFVACHAWIGQPSIAPERLMRALLLQAFHPIHSIRSERRVMGRVEFDLLFRWFVSLAIDDRVSSAWIFLKSHDRLMKADAAGEFLSSVVRYPQVTLPPISEPARSSPAGVVPTPQAINLSTGRMV